MKETDNTNDNTNDNINMETLFNTLFTDFNKDDLLAFFNWYEVSYKIKYNIVKSNPDLPWDYEELSTNKNNPDLPWDDEGLSLNEIININKI